MIEKKNFLSQTAAYQKIHWKLTLLFTGITGLLLVILSICYLYMSEKELKNNSWLSFLNESNTIITNFEHNSTISYSWLSKISANNKFIIAIYDNKVPLSYTITKLSKKEQELTDAVLAKAQQKLSSDSTSLYDSPPNITGHYHDRDNAAYYTNTARLGNAQTPLEAVILFPTKDLQIQRFRQRLRFLFVDITGVLLLFCFTYYYTKKLLSPLLENLERQNIFIATASHELRTPLAIILSSVSAFHQADTSKQKSFLQTIEAEGKRMSHLINDMMILAKTSQHTWPFQIKHTELDTLLLNCYEAFLPIAQEKKIELQIQLPEENIPPYRCDEQRITQVVNILLSNAISYGRENGYAKLILKLSKSNYYITVEDNGIGISPQAKEHIFERFYRENNSHSQKEHFGLGLCIAKEIIDFHHGKIIVSNTKKGGTTVTIRLPR